MFTWHHLFLWQGIFPLSLHLLLSLLLYRTSGCSLALGYPIRKSSHCLRVLLPFRKGKIWGRTRTKDGVSVLPCLQHSQMRRCPHSLRKCGSSQEPCRQSSEGHSHFWTKTKWHHGNLSYIECFSCFLVRNIYLQS